MLNRIASAAAFVVVLFALGGVLGAQQDTIVLKDGKERKTKILSEDYDSVKFALEGGTQDLRWKQIDSIRYSGAESYYKAVETLTGGKLVDSLPLLEALAADTKLRNVLRQGVLFHLGNAYGKQGDVDKSIATHEQLLADFPKSRYLTSVGANLLAAYRAKGDAAGAAKSIDAALAASKSASGDAALDADLNVLRGMVLLEQKKYADAERSFSSAASAAGASPNTIASAKLGLARAAADNGQKSEAEKRFREIVVSDASNTVLGAAWNGLADLAFEQAIAARDRDGLRVALFAYMRAMVQYPPDRDSATEEHERAIAGAAKTFEAMGQLEGNADRKKLSAGRGKERWDYLANKYPRSRFNKK